VERRAARDEETDPGRGAGDARDQLRQIGDAVGCVKDEQDVAVPQPVQESLHRSLV
jgi:hypothetical protein